MLGIDISWHNGWPFSTATAAGYAKSDFVIVKATQGVLYSHADYFYKAINKALADGKLVGAYHYAKGLDAVKEADYFLDIVKPYLGKIILALDWETSADAAGKNYAWGNGAWIKAFIDHIRQRTGQVCFFYSGMAGASQCPRNIVDYTPLWFSGYPTSVATWEVPAWPARYTTSPWDKYTIWQYTNSFNTLDRNYTPMDKATWQQYAKPKEDVIMEVKVGSARIDEHGNATGGKPGDQTGREVMIENWYNHPQGWITLRAKDSVIANKLADAMTMACHNDNIGYNQYQRNTLYTVAERVGFNLSKVTTKCNTDCSALVRVCLAYAGIMVPDFNTSTERNIILNTGKFIQVPTDKTTAQRGDILVTRTKGHTVIVTQAIKRTEPAPDKEEPKGEEEMQCLFTVDGKNKETPYWFDGQAIHTLTHKDQASIIRTIYKDNNGKAIPEYAWTSKAPWYIRLKQAVDGKAPTKW